MSKLKSDPVDERWLVKADANATISAQDFLKSVVELAKTYASSSSSIYITSVESTAAGAHSVRIELRMELKLVPKLRSEIRSLTGVEYIEVWSR